MMDKAMEIDWDTIVTNTSYEIYMIDELEDYDDIKMSLYTQTYIIFNSLKRLKRKRFFTDREVDYIWVVLNGDILHLNDLSLGIENEIYTIINTIFNELIELCIHIEDYECASNLSKFKDFWFSSLNIKIRKFSGTKQK
jgi:hypothetical protein